MSETTVEASVPVDDRSGESEDDVIGRLGAQRANVTATDWTIETLITQMIKGRLDLDPSFQRRAAWTTALKSKFIESTLLSYPIPQIVLAEKLDRPGHFIVIDGKQRLLALRQFYAGLDEYADDKFKSYRLSTVTVIDAIKNFTIARLKRERPDLFDTFETHTIRTVVIRNWGTEDFLYTLFLRLNTGSVPLSPQELRQALVPGPFVQFAEEASGDSPGLQRLLGNRGPDRRMVDAEVLVRMIGLRSPIKYRGNLKDFLDRVCKHYNSNWDQLEGGVLQLVENMEKAIEAVYQVFGDGAACRKWTTNKYERAFNRAIFDFQVGALLDGNAARQAFIDAGDDLVARYKMLCDLDSDFARSITTTTKTNAAFSERLSKWYDIFEGVTGFAPTWPQAIDRVESFGEEPEGE
ncbi:DUF262 domain-containing protein [Lentzea nigeriaca]|uniref:DUF262 domain-containing protein n=1 Tax=Lentzea nigeriaca TaxID=1128665 RepID=UPI00195BBCC8|nr:DUF262 domain-containing protein [Lentzea nigeriaca]MBM7861891.1 hypothetical protein [Lentzea nigeriaca]